MMDEITKQLVEKALGNLEAIRLYLLDGALRMEEGIADGEEEELFMEMLSGFAEVRMTSVEEAWVNYNDLDEEEALDPPPLPPLTLKTYGKVEERILEGKLYSVALITDCRAEVMPN
jgi:hypothetical protein